MTYLVLQPPGFTAMLVAKQGRELLPHVFTLTLRRESTRGQMQGGIFSVALFRTSIWVGSKPPFTLSSSFPLGSGALCVVRTFLSSFWQNLKNSDRTGSLLNKYIKNLTEFLIPTGLLLLGPVGQGLPLQLYRFL